MGSHNVWDGAFAPYKRFAAGKTLAQGGIYFRRASKKQGSHTKP